MSDFSGICISFWFHVRRLLTRTKNGEKYNNKPCNHEKNVTGVTFDVFTVFFGEHVKSLYQQCLWMDQKKSVMFRAESVFFRNDRRKNQLISELVQWCSDIVRVYSTEQTNVSGFISLSHSGGGRDDVYRITTKSISGMKLKSMPSSSSI